MPSNWHNPTNKPEAALALRLAGADYREIADVIGYGSATIARREVVRTLAVSATDADRTYHRNRAQQRLEALLDAVWDSALRKGDSEQLPAVRTARELIHEMVNLQGAAVPTEVVVHNQSTSQLLEWMTDKGLIETPAVEETDPFADAVDAEVVEDGE
jgi:hypothetical protein